MRWSTNVSKCSQRIETGATSGVEGKLIESEEIEVILTDGMILRTLALLANGSQFSSQQLLDEKNASFVFTDFLQHECVLTFVWPRQLQAPNEA